MGEQPISLTNRQRRPNDWLRFHKCLLKEMISPEYNLNTTYYILKKIQYESLRVNYH